VYAIGATSGEMRWVHSTGDWVYGSPAVANRTVFVGSYDGTFYALDARTGDERWTFEADDRIAGSATVIDDVVYFSTLGGTTYGLDIRTGRVRWSTDDGRTAGIVTDGEWVFLGGESELHGYVPASTKQPTGAQRSAERQEAPSAD
jgi:outer membrane protein assembly factor BamB